jgi:hypothetical protein
MRREGGWLEGGKGGERERESEREERKETHMREGEKE